MDCSFQTEIRNWKGGDPSLHESNKIDEGTKLWWTNRMEVSGWKVKPLTTHPETRFKTLLAAPRRCAIGAIDTYRSPINSDLYIINNLQMRKTTIVAPRRPLFSPN